jgi:colanic acid/amylovoran biosynthesis glycosyltransferase
MWRYVLLARPDVSAFAGTLAAVRLDGMSSQVVRPWALPDRPWILHSTELLGVLTERWIQTQVDAHRTFAARLLGYKAAAGADRQENWLVASDRLADRLSSLAMLKADGLGSSVVGRRFRGRPPVAIHAHFGVIAAPQRKLARSLGVPLVAGFYGYDASLDRVVGSRVWKRRYRRLFDEVAAVVVEGPAMAGRVRALGCPDEKLHVIRLPADARGLGGVSQSAPDTFVVVEAGRFVGKKGFDTGIRAFAKAFRGTAARLVMMGGGELEPSYRRFADELGIAGQITWLASLPFLDFMGHIAGASVALFPSRTAPDGDTEGGAPVTLIETQWLGVPVLVSDHDDLPFVAAPDGSLVLPATDVDAWAEALQALYQSPSSLREMGGSAMAFAKAHHSPEANAAAREALYGEVSGKTNYGERSLTRA